MDSIQKLKNFYAVTPESPFYLKEFLFYSLDRWIGEGHLRPRDQVSDYKKYLREMFGFDEPAAYELWDLGWCEAPMDPWFEEKILKDMGEYELVRDKAGRGVVYFKGRRNGFMPEYKTAPVSDIATFEEKIAWRLNPESEGRIAIAREEGQKARVAAASGKLVIQRLIGGFMYLRSLMNVEDMLFSFYEQPELIHRAMECWLNVMDAMAAVHQQYVDFDEVFLSEDICYNVSSLISPEMVREFLFPYYQQLLTNIKRRQKSDRKLNIQIDTDGYCPCVIDLYAEGIGANYFSPFEVASGCDVVEIGKKYPNLLMLGGIDKRVLSTSKDKIEKYLDSVLPAMFKRGGYIPTCDHGVPAEVSFENYILFREKIKEYSK